MTQKTIDEIKDIYEQLEEKSVGYMEYRFAEDYLYYCPLSEEVKEENGLKTREDCIYYAIKNRQEPIVTTEFSYQTVTDIGKTELD